MLKTGNKYRIGKNIFKVVCDKQIELCCSNVCDVKDCSCNKDFEQFKKDAGVQLCLELLGYGRHFELTE